MNTVEIKELTPKQMEEVCGGLWANVAGVVIGAISGGIGGFYGSIIAGGQNAGTWDIAKGVAGGIAAGAFAGAINPISSVGSAITAVAVGGGSGAVGGGASQVIDEIRMHKAE